MSEIIQTITADIADLKRLINSNDLVGRLEKVDRIVTNCWYLSSMVADAYEASQTAEYLYKSSLASAISGSQEGVGRAEAKAKHTYANLYEEWVKADVLYKRYNLLLSSANAIVEQFRSSNSYLKMEYANSKM